MFDLNKVLQSVEKLTKDGVPLNVNVEKQTLSTTGAYLLGGFAIAGFLIGGLIAIGIYLKK